MSFDELRSGVVLAYPFLWAHQRGRGETEGRKLRPVAVAVRLARAGGDVLVLLPITTKPPPAERIAVEVPAGEKRRAGLDAKRVDRS